MSTERAEASLPVMPYTAASFSIIGRMRLSTVATLELVTHHRRNTHRRLHRPQHGMLTQSRAPNRPGIAHAIDHHGVGVLAFRLDDAGDRAQLRQLIS